MQVYIWSPIYATQYNLIFSLHALQNSLRTIPSFSLVHECINLYSYSNQLQALLQVLYIKLNRLRAMKAMHYGDDEKVWEGHYDLNTRFAGPHFFCIMR